METLKKVIGGIFDFFLVIIIVCAIGVTLISLTSDNNNVSKIGKYIPLNVMTDSMEPTIMEGDFIIMEECDPESLEVGDVISFLATEQDYVIIKTHRIVAVDTSSGFKAFTTRGDNNDVNDSVPVFSADIVGKWNDVKIPKLGKVLNFISSKTGFLVCIVLPLLVLFIYQIYKFIVVVMEERGNSKLNDEAAILEAAAKIQAERAAKEEKKKDKEKEEEKNK